jgi:hypothetical protein
VSEAACAGTALTRLSVSAIAKAKDRMDDSIGP